MGLSFIHKDHETFQQECECIGTAGKEAPEDTGPWGQSWKCLSRELWNGQEGHRGASLRDERLWSEVLRSLQQQCTHDILGLPLLSNILILSSALQEDFVLDGSRSPLFVFVFNE